jgi:PKD repeat protein
VHLADTFLNAKSYIWDFGDGSPQIATTNPDTSHTYAIVGKYRVMLIAIDPASCNVRDTSYVTIIARNDRANLAFTPQKTGLCTDLSFNFTNGSTAPPGKPFVATSFQWDFGDGTPLVSAGTNTVSHTYAAAGTYRVKLLLPDSNYCNSPDSLVQTVRLSPNVKAQFTTPPGGCVPYNAQFTNTSLGGLHSLGLCDGQTSTDSDPTHLYS